MAHNGDTQDGPIQDQHPQPDDAKVAGILAQQEGDLAGHDEAQILDALRQRFSQSGLEIDEDALQGHARRIAKIDSNSYSEE
jgi:hypothetical protein